MSMLRTKGLGQLDLEKRPRRNVHGDSPGASSRSEQRCVSPRHDSHELRRNASAWIYLR